jgi:hypothetical protein
VVWATSSNSSDVQCPIVGTVSPSVFANCLIFISRLGTAAAKRRKPPSTPPIKTLRPDHATCQRVPIKMILPSNTTHMVAGFGAPNDTRQTIAMSSSRPLDDGVSGFESVRKTC